MKLKTKMKSYEFVSIAIMTNSGKQLKQLVSQGQSVFTFRPFIFFSFEFVIVHYIASLCKTMHEVIK